MKIKKIAAVSLAFAMVLSLASCGNADTAEGNDNETVESTEEEVAAGEAVIDPTYIHPGSLNDEKQVEETSDLWYPEGDTDSDDNFFLIYTPHQISNIGLKLQYYKTIGEHLTFFDAILNGGDGHAKTNSKIDLGYDIEPFDMDITFQDDFTCYDNVSKTTWKRSHPDWGCKPQEWYDEAFSGLVGYRDFSTNSQYIILNEDHSFAEQIREGDKITDEKKGKWEVKSANVLWLIYDNPEDAGPEAVDITAALGLEDDGEEVEDVTRNVWPQEFNISEDGKITEFGVYPTFDENNNMSFKSTFELTTIDEIDAANEASAAAADESKAAGSPYATPEDIRDISGVNLDQTPDYTVEYGDWDGWRELKDSINKGEVEGYVGEIHGIMSVAVATVSISYGSDEESHNSWIDLTVADSTDFSELPEDGTKVKITGVFWKSGNNPYLVTDKAHIVIE